MAAPANKPVGYQVAVIVLSLLIVVLGTVVYMDFKNYKLVNAQLTDSNKKLGEAEKNYKQRDDEYQDLKKKTGNLYDAYGLGEDANNGKVAGAAMADIGKAGPLAEPTYKAAINKLVQQAADLEKERDKLRTDIEGQQKLIAALSGQYQVQVDQNNNGRTKAEKDLQDLIKVKDEEVRSKQKRVDELTQSYNELQTEFDNEKQARVQEAKKLNEDITRLVAINDKLVKRIDEVTKTSFEVPSGMIRHVDNQNGLVWINLGEADNLPKRMTFSVYTKSHNGVARGTEDIKGAIEVTRIIDEHTAEARITHDDLYKPIAKGDPIFTPVWRPGRKDNFSFIGLIDLDGDGKSDRQRIHELIASTGGGVDNEVLDDGKRVRYTKFPSEWVEYEPETVPGIDVNTKFLVIGQIPDISQAAKDEDKERINKMLVHRKKLEQEARQQGVRLVNLNDFLAWIGYTPQRRLFTPGNEKGYELKAGQRPAPIDNVGRVSAAVSDKSKRLKPQSSTGTTSGAFGK